MLSSKIKQLHSLYFPIYGLKNTLILRREKTSICYVLYWSFYTFLLLFLLLLLLLGFRRLSLCEKCQFSEFFWSVFSRIRIEYREVLYISPYSIRMQENTCQKTSEYGHFSRSVWLLFSSTNLACETRKHSLLLSA